MKKIGNTPKLSCMRTRTRPRHNNPGAEVRELRRVRRDARPVAVQRVPAKDVLHRKLLLVPRILFQQAYSEYQQNFTVTVTAKSYW